MSFETNEDRSIESPQQRFIKAMSAQIGGELQAVLKQAFAGTKTFADARGLVIASVETAFLTLEQGTFPAEASVVKKET